MASLRDGVLWPVVDRLSGFSVSDKVRSRNCDTSLPLATSPSGFVSKLFPACCVHDSQKGERGTLILSPVHS